VELVMQKIPDLFKSELKVVNIGLEIFNEAMEAQGVKSVHVTWKSAPKLEKEYEDILSKIL
jgi:hypothetical protein